MNPKSSGKDRWNQPRMRIEVLAKTERPLCSRELTACTTRMTGDQKKGKDKRGHSLN